MYWLTFVGEGRSGHTLVSGILGSHPNVRISEEQKYISKWCRGISREDIIRALLASGGGKYRRSMGFENLDTYTEPLLVMGDKCGWDAVNEVKRRGQASDILTRFSDFIEMPVKVIHTTRHPLDNISAWVDSPKYARLYPERDRRFNKMIARYCKFYEAAEEIMAGQDVFHLRNETLIENSSDTIQKLSDWLDLPPNKGWRRASAKYVNATPHRRRDACNWPDKYLDQVNGSRVLDRFPSLSYYK